MQIQFSQNIVNFHNATAVINSTSLLVKGLHGDAETPIALTWYAVNYPANDTLQLQVVFNNSKTISADVKNVNLTSLIGFRLPSGEVYRSELFLQLSR